MFGTMFGGMFSGMLGQPIEFNGKQYTQICSFGYIGENENKKQVLLVVEADGDIASPLTPVVIIVPASWLKKG